MTREELYEKAAGLPLSSGVYIMKNEAGDVIYVGKSKKLRNRVSQYFAKIPHSVKTERMVEAVRDFDYILTDSESEALILENIQIKKYLPKYNILLKDDKNYQYIKITAGDFPRLTVTRKMADDGGEYFGPFTLGSAAKTADTVARMFMLPTCKRSFPKDIGRERPCLNYQIGRCVGVCTGKVSKEEYARTVADMRTFLRGHQEKAVSSLTAKMNDASEKLEFEKAAAYRDTIKKIKLLREKQKVQGSAEKNADFVAVYDSDDGCALTLATVRDGCFADKVSYRFSSETVSDAPALASVLWRIYSERTDVPRRVFTDFDADGEDFDALKTLLSEKAGHAVSVARAKIGDNKKLLDMVKSNAQEYVKQYNEKQRRDGKTLVKLAKLLAMDAVPVRIESYDVSNWGNDFISTGMIVVENGAFAKRAYRSFNAKKNTSQNDCACMAEAVERRIKHAKDGDEGFLPLPDLILVDGGKAQVSAVKEVVGREGVPAYVFGMVKDRHHKTRTLTNGQEEISIAHDGEIFGFIYKIQDEIHRFSFSKMDRRRRDSVKHSLLEDVPGIGKTRAKALMERFGSVGDLKKADAGEIAKIRGFSKKLAEKLVEDLKKIGGEEQ